MPKFSRSLVALAAVGAFSLPALAADYVLQAAQWGPAQEAAVAAAGGKVRFAHASGIAVVSAERADFLKQALAGGAIQSGAEDRIVQFTPELRSFDYPVDAQGVTLPINDAYFRHIQWAPQSVQAPEAWAAGYTGKGVRVAIIDGGIHGTHPDLVANIDVAAARSFASPIAGDTPAGLACTAKWNCDLRRVLVQGQPVNVHDSLWHGTHVAGIVAAPANGLGVVGIAPEATIVPVKALHAGSGSFGAIIQAIMYAATEGRADIINMSLGAEFERGSREAAELTSAMNRAVNFASRQGVLVVSAAGNSGLDLDHSGNVIATPAQSGNGLAISSTGPLGFGYGATNYARPASYTNYGTSAIAVAAPGGDFAYEGVENCTRPGTLGGSVTIPCWAFDMVISTVRGSAAGNGAYSWTAGTSMAAPAASAVAALIKQKYPSANAGQLKAMLQQSAIDLGKPGADPMYGKGYVNALRAVSQ